MSGGIAYVLEPARDSSAAATRRWSISSRRGSRTCSSCGADRAHVQYTGSGSDRACSRTRGAAIALREVMPARLQRVLQAQAGPPLPDAKPHSSNWWEPGPMVKRQGHRDSAKKHPTRAPNRFACGTGARSICRIRGGLRDQAARCMDCGIPSSDTTAARSAT